MQFMYLWVFFVHGLGVLFEDHLVLEPFAAQLAQVGLVDRRVVHL